MGKLEVALTRKNTLRKKSLEEPDAKHSPLLLSDTR